MDKRKPPNKSKRGRFTYILTEIDIKKIKLDVRRPLTASETQRLRNDFIVDFTYNSNADEGNTLTLKKNAMAPKGMAVGRKPCCDVFDAFYRDGKPDYMVLLAAKYVNERLDPYLEKERSDEMIYISGNTPKAYYPLNVYLRNKFGKKMIKLSIDGGFTCPNRDGRSGTGGCIFCSDSGSGEFASHIEDQIRLLSEKWPDAGYLAYFQNHSNTYGPVEDLRYKYEKALSHPLIEGIAIATRPDCLPEEVLELLSEIGENHFMWVELGLQTIHGKTAEDINRCYDLSVFDRAVDELKKRNIKTVVHLILGLPGETKAHMEQSVRYVCEKGVWGLKLHLLNVIRKTALERKYPDYVPFHSPEEYINLVCDLLEIIPPDMVIHRLTGDVPRKLLVSPQWSYRKRTILNGIDAEMKRRASFQGCRL